MFLISSYGAPLAQRASLHCSLFGPVVQLRNYDYVVTNSINSLLIGSRWIPNDAHTNHCWANLAHVSKLIKNSDKHIYDGIAKLTVLRMQFLIKFHSLFSCFFFISIFYKEPLKFGIHGNQSSGIIDAESRWFPILNN